MLADGDCIAVTELALAGCTALEPCVAAVACAAATAGTGCGGGAKNLNHKTTTNVENTIAHSMFLSITKLLLILTF
jgi:hypothetical protein